MCTALVGNEGIVVDIEVKTDKELYQLVEQSHNLYLKYQVLVNQMHNHCYFREYLPCAELAEIYQNSQMENHTFDTLVRFYAGLCEHYFKCKTCDCGS